MENIEEKRANSIDRFRSQYGDLLPLNPDVGLPDEHKRLIDKVFKNKIDPSRRGGKSLEFGIQKLFEGKVLTFISESIAVRETYIYLLLQLQTLLDAKFLTLSDLLNIHFGTHPIYSSIDFLESYPIVLIYVDPVTNRLKDECLLHAIELITRKNCSVWLYYRGVVKTWLSEFPQTVRFVKNVRFMSIDAN